MKMSKPLYTELKADIVAVAAHHNIVLGLIPERIQMQYMYKLHIAVDENRAYDDAWMRSTNNTRILPYTGRKYCHLYDHGLHDTHIATALKQMLKEILADWSPTR